MSSTRHQLNRLVPMRHNPLFCQVCSNFPNSTPQSSELGLASTVTKRYLQIRVPKQVLIRHSKAYNDRQIPNLFLYNSYLYTPNRLMFSEHIRKHGKHWVEPTSQQLTQNSRGEFQNFVPDTYRIHRSKYLMNK